MQTMAQEVFTSTYFQLLGETFDGPPPEEGSAYLDKGAGLFQTLERLAAEEASTAVGPGAPTIAGHCEHVRFYLVALHEFMRGATDKVDWKQSWRVQAVTAEEWNAAREGLRQAYTTATDHLRSVVRWGDSEVSDGMAILVHTAYHLGAIRQLVRALAVNHMDRGST